jgi:hypothetical protein
MSREEKELVEGWNSLPLDVKKHILKLSIVMVQQETKRKMQEMLELCTKDIKDHMEEHNRGEWGYLDCIGIPTHERKKKKWFIGASTS